MNHDSIPTENSRPHPMDGDTGQGLCEMGCEELRDARPVSTGESGGTGKTRVVTQKELLILVGNYACAAINGSLVEMERAGKEFADAVSATGLPYE